MQPNKSQGSPSQERAVEQASAAPVRACPICGKASSVANRPFCSKRCADVDLHRWLGGVYAIPITNEDAQPNSASAPEDSED
jgi:endogenous inhibitor of DNA gyrase (YacG/DUF329 family)